MLVYLFARQSVPIAKLNLDSLHRRDIKTGLAKVSGEFLVDVALVRSQPEKTFDAHCMQRFAVAHPCSHHWNAILVLPALDKLSFRFISADHERRSAFRMDQINSDARQFANALVVNVHRAQIFVFSVFLRANEKRHNSHAVREQTDEIYQRP